MERRRKGERGVDWERQENYVISCYLVSDRPSPNLVSWPPLSTLLWCLVISRVYIQWLSITGMFKRWRYELIGLYPRNMSRIILALTFLNVSPFLAHQWLTVLHFNFQLSSSILNIGSISVPRGNKLYGLFKTTSERNWLETEGWIHSSVPSIYPFNQGEYCNR